MNEGSLGTASMESHGMLVVAAGAAWILIKRRTLLLILVGLSQKRLTYGGAAWRYGVAWASLPGLLILAGVPIPLTFVAFFFALGCGVGALMAVFVKLMGDSISVMPMPTIHLTPLHEVVLAPIRVGILLSLPLLVIGSAGVPGTAFYGLAIAGSLLGGAALAHHRPLLWVVSEDTKQGAFSSD